MEGRKPNSGIAEFVKGAYERLDLAPFRECRFFFLSHGYIRIDHSAAPYS
jgi:hypothetical protein